MSTLVSLAIEALGTYLNRVVVVLTPLFAAVSAYVVGFIVENVPGAPELTTDQLTALMVAGALAATHAAVTWIKGWASHQETQLNLDYVETELGAGYAVADAGPDRQPLG